MTNGDYDKEQYELLKQCLKRSNLQNWNDWRIQNPESKVNLARADFKGAWLFGVDLHGANLHEAHFEDATLAKAKLQGAHLDEAFLQKSMLNEADLKGARLQHVRLKRAHFFLANLQGAHISNAKLHGASFDCAKVDGSTVIVNCEIDKETDFTGVGLDSAIVDPGLKQALKNNIRRLQWQKWYQEEVKAKGCWAKVKNIPIKLFWWMSDYGSSTTKIIKLFFILSVYFALLYYFWWLIDYQTGCHDKSGIGIVKDLIPDDFRQNPLSGIVFLRTLYFSIVTMTTLGFGDMHANPNSWWGHIFLMLQVLIGYVMLGALITRFAILFSGDGPAQEPDPPPPKKRPWYKTCKIRMRQFKRELKICIKQLKPSKKPSPTDT